MTSSKKLWIGYHEKDQAPFFLTLEDLYTHVAIIGSSGSGKTVLAKSLIESAIVNDVPCVVIDPQGDLVKLAQMLDSAQVPEDELHQQLHDMFDKKVFPVIFTPGTKYGLKCIFNPLASFPDPTKVHVHRGMIFDSFIDETKPEAIVVSEEDLSLLLGGIADGILSFVPDSYLRGRNRPLSRVVLFKSLSQAFESGLPLNSISDLIEWMQQLDEANFFSDSEERNLSNLIEALRIITEGPEAVLFTEGIPIDPNIFLDAPEGKVPLVVFYLNVLPTLESRQAFVANLTLLLYSYCLQKGSGNFLYFIDEIRDFIPPGTKQPPSKGILKTFFTQSRKYKVVSVIATQSVGSIDYEVLGQCNTRAYGRLTVEQELRKLREFLPPERLDQLPHKVPGHFLIHSKRGGFHDVVVRKLVTEHGSPVPPQMLPHLMSTHEAVIDYYRQFWSTQSDDGSLAAEEQKLTELHEPISFEASADFQENVPSEDVVRSLPVEDRVNGTKTQEASTNVQEPSGQEYELEAVLSLLREELINMFRVRFSTDTFKISWKVIDDQTLSAILNRPEVEYFTENALGGKIYQARVGSMPILFSMMPVEGGNLVVTAFT